MTATRPLDRLRLADHVRPRDVVAWPQGPGEPLALTEARVEQAPGLGRPTLCFGMTVSRTLQPALARHVDPRACGLRERARRLAAIAHPDHRDALLRASPAAA